MSHLSIASLFPFRRVCILNSEELEIGSGPAGLVEARPDKRFSPLCSNCGSIARRIHDHNFRFIRDLSLGQHQIMVQLHYRKVKCQNCKSVRVEELDICPPGGPRTTHRLANYIQDLCKFMTVDEVANHLNLDWKTVKAIEKRGLQKQYGLLDYRGLRYLAVDEIAIGKHHKYLTVVIDFETGRVVWVGKNRQYETLKGFFSQLPEKIIEGIEAVAMDMWDPYIKAVTEFCPNAHIVFDFFHIVAKYNDVIDEVRRQEVKKLENDTEKKAIKGTRWILLKNRNKLKEKEEIRLEELLKANDNLAKVYILRDDLKLVWKNTDRDKMSKELDDWCQKAMETGLKPLAKFVKTLKRHKEGILNHADHPIHTSKLEGINNKIKVIIRKAYGYHDYEYLVLKIKEACSGFS